MRRPSPQLLDLLSDCTPGVVDLTLALREVVLNEAPEAEEVLYSVYAQVIVFRIPGRKRGAFCGVVAYKKHVNLMFYFGAELEDPRGLLEGTGKQMRHIRFDSPEQVRQDILRSYIRAARAQVGEQTLRPARKKQPAKRKTQPRQ